MTRPAASRSGRLDPEGDRDQATARLLDYYQRAATLADALLGRRASAIPVPAVGLTPAAVPALADREQALAWARAERASLLACLDHAIGTGQDARIIALTTGLAGLLRHDGPWAEAVTRHIAAWRAAQRLGDRPGQASALTSLGIVRGRTGNYPAAARDLEEALGISRDLGDRPGQALDLARQIGGVWDEAHALAGLGRCALPGGHTARAADMLRQALEIFQQIGAAEAADVSRELSALIKAGPTG